MKFERWKSPVVNISGIVLDCPDADELADFYQRLLGWEKNYSGNGWAGLTAPNGMVLAFQTIDEYKPPVWPWKQDAQGQMMHLDFKVDNLDEAVAFAVCCGARIAEEQFFNDSRTMIDPVGHPFCLDTSHS